MANDTVAPQNFDKLPPGMLEFTLLQSATKLAPRLGRLSLEGHKTILTPGFVGCTSRGVVPHITQDNLRKHTALAGVYVALEDFVEKHPQQTPPILEFNTSNTLRQFTALPQDTFLVLGARRQPPITCPNANTNSEVSILTSVGFRAISSEYYAAAARKLKPDIVVGLADIPFGQVAVGLKRKDKMSDRTEAWMRDIIAKQSTIDRSMESRFSIFAPILPIDKELQSWYLNHLIDDMVNDIDGLAIYDSNTLDWLPDDLQHFPRLTFDNPPSPQAVLRQISLGMDIFTVPFVSEATDAGIVLDFTFPAPINQNTAITAPRSLGIDMWSKEHASVITPLTKECKCYTCTNHHRAYLQHLLAAKEMLGWVLIQLHNHAVLDSFFAGIRQSLQNETFDEDTKAFELFYESNLPEKSGQGPRVRGYQFQANEHANSKKKNPKAFRKFEGERPLKAFHGQQPNEKPKVKDRIDEDALEGLMDLEGSLLKKEIGCASIEHQR